MSKFQTFRGVYFLAFLATLIFIIIQFYQQAVIGYQPCAMIFLERLIFLLLAFLFITASVLHHSEFTQKISSWLCAGISLIGLFVSGKHVWIQLSTASAQSLPNVTAEQLQRIPFLTLIHLGFHGANRCAQIVWTAFGLSVAKQSFVFFILLGALSIWQSIRKFQKTKT